MTTDVTTDKKKREKISVLMLSHVGSKLETDE